MTLPKKSLAMVMTAPRVLEAQDLPMPEIDDDARVDQSGEVVGVVTSMLHPLAALQIAGVVPQNVNYALKSEFAYALLTGKLAEGWEADPPRIESDLIEMVRQL